METGRGCAGADLALQPKSTPIFPLPAQHAKAQRGLLKTCPGPCEPLGTEGTSSSDLPRSLLVPFCATLPILLPPLLGEPLSDWFMGACFLYPCEHPSHTSTSGFVDFPVENILPFGRPLPTLAFPDLRRCSSICAFLPFLCVSLISHLPFCCPRSSV